MEADMRRMSTISFSLFSSWLLAFAFEGQVFYAILDTYNTDAYALSFGSIAAHFIGLFACGFFVKNMKTARKLMLFTIIYCFLISMVFFFPPSMLWNILLLSAAFLSGAFVSAWGFYFKEFTPANGRLKTAADVLIYSNLLMILLNMSAILISPPLGLALSMLMLTAAFFVQVRLPESPKKSTENRVPETEKKISPAGPLAFLCLFIVVITINSGLMYQVLNPAFAHHEWLVSWYWAVPYIAAMYIIRNLPAKINRNYMLYIGIAMIGLSFIGFMVLDRSVAGYLVINTLMMGACGIYDLFWWSILGEMLDFHHNPSRILGIGLSANVLGVLIGGMLGNTIAISGDKGSAPSILALTIVLIILALLPPLHKHLSALLRNHAFLADLSEMTETKQEETISDFMDLEILTEREREITSLLLRGRTYKMISAELYLSENTIKTHIKNIYSKFNVQSKVELINLLAKNKPVSKK